MATKVTVQRKVVKPPRARPTRPRAGLSRARLVEMAMSIADATGIEALSMRRLAHELGVETMSLYHYFRGKNELLGAMLAAVYAEYELPSGEADWRADMRRSAVSAHAALLRHPWAPALQGQPTDVSRAQLSWMNALLGRLRSAGFSAEMTHHAYHAIESHIVGFTLWLLPILAVSRSQPDLVERFADAVSQSALPHLIEHVDYHLADQRDTDTSEFEFGLDLLLDGLERLRGNQVRPANQVRLNGG